MAGKDCVALVLDSRFGSGTGLVNVQARRVLFPPNGVGKSEQSSLFVVALQGLQGDVLSLEHELTMAMQHNYARASLGDGGRTNIAIPCHIESEEDITASDLSRQREQQASSLSSLSSYTTISPRSLASYTSHLLYQRKNAPYYVEPMIVGLEKRLRTPTDGGDNGRPTQIMQDYYRPYLCSMDMLGSLQEQPKQKPAVDDVDDDENNKYKDCTFACMGAAVPSLYGTAQAFWKPNMEAEELAETCVKAFLAAMERDCLSGYGARLYLLTATKGLSVYDIVTRND
ncbi:hypothetical protein ACA910_015696 [Epithemia clementina (nom. ined.)]